ncbi:MULTISPECIES: ribosome biogenesis GTP-binding protein YihA/YsxC [unclassified Desulfurobacterium]|uniref:ribosome biogenesis GTP-binding protein YihA/YsxC n=1 Tax=unclassified Desulfurobacterium TaxID=2639089 RepID=UPI0003B6A5F2|nr:MULTISPECIES: ribosome biogenesis GTP-binding protein YihA/YsxC [unclassified Desulfurobacterium]
MITVKKAQLYKTVFKPEDLPDTPYNEVAFVGRSNVGKSSLLNTIVKNYRLAKVSSSPGKTRSVNFYFVNDRFFVVDLPGYGFARLSKAEQRRWKELIESYLTGRDKLKGVFLLVDSKVGPTDKDIMMKEWLEYYGIPFCVVATKVDRLKKQSERATLKRRIRQKLGIDDSVNVIPFSARTREGRVEILKQIEQFLEQ